MGSDGRIRMPDGRLAPRVEGLVCLKERLDSQALLLMDKVNGASSVLQSLGYSISSSCSDPVSSHSHSIPLSKSAL